VANLSDETFYQAVQPHLAVGEQVRHFGYGLERPPAWLALLLVLGLAVLPGLALVALLTKHYVVALTDRRLIVVRLKGGLLRIDFDTKAVRAYTPAELAALPLQVTLRRGFTEICIADSRAPLRATFPRRVSRGNGPNMAAIGAALQGLRPPLAVPGIGSPAPSPGAVAAPPSR